MCGICGFIHHGGAEDLAPMLERVAHRGPDGEGRTVITRGEWLVALGHRRLSIINLETGAQPMQRGRATITYNGELYNFRELRRDLESRGRVFRTKSDTEVLMAHVDEHWTAGLAALSGMFAFALWDDSSRRLLLARDRVGIKPLYYAALPGGGLAFASELSSLLAHPGVPRSISRAGLASYFFSDYVQAPFTMIEGARKLAPGHFVVWQDGVLQEPSPFWTVGSPRSSVTESDDVLATHLWQRLDAAVERQLVADVPVGVFLSGGLDSSTVLALASVHSEGPTKAFSIGFEDATFDESPYARSVARRFGVEYIEERLDEGNLLAVVDEAIQHLDEPLADPSYLPTYLLSRLASQHVKVVLGGDGGDELWGGYPTYRAHRYARVYARLPSFVRRGIIAPLVARLPTDDRYQSVEWKLRRFALRWDDDATTRHLRWMSSIDLPDLAAALPFVRDFVPASLATTLPETNDALHRMLALDFQTYLPGSVLAKVDRASMAHGLEVRPALLDNDLIDWALSLPSKLKVRNETTKYLFKKAARGHLPNDIIDRPKKGFGIPLAAWLRGPLRHPIASILERSPAWDSGLLDRRTFEQYNAEHLARRADKSKPLWGLFVFDRWLHWLNAKSA